MKYNADHLDNLRVKYNADRFNLRMKYNADRLVNLRLKYNADHLDNLRVKSPSMRFILRSLCNLWMVCLFTASAAVAQAPPGPSSPLYGARPETGNPSTGLPAALQDVRIDQKLDQQLPLDLLFRDESGQQVKLGQYFGKKPVVLAFVYYDCPMLCTQVLNGMVTSFRVLPFQIGNEFEVVTVSFDPRETNDLAAAKKKVYLDYLPDKMQSGANNGWHFLTGDQASIAQLTDAAGFRYRYDEATKQFAHASAIMLATPQGKLSRYFYGIEYAPRDLRLGLIESSENKIGSPMDQLLLYCYHYDPATGKYGTVVMRVMRIAGVITLLGIVAMLFLLKARNTFMATPKPGGAAH
jgi:protein SCO1/2